MVKLTMPFYVYHFLIIVVSGVAGRQVLQDLVKKWGEEYNNLSPVEKATLTKEYEQRKAQVAKGTRISSRSKVKDVVTTMNVVENMVS
jgi:hypothetical protein